MDLTDLLSTCVDACERGCAEIRRVAAQLDRNNEGGVRQVDYKIAGDPRSALTAADLAAQLAVVEPLATAWPGLRIVGEEDLACDVGAAADGAVCASPLIEVQPVPVLRRDRCDGLRKYASIAQEERRDIVEASLERVTVFVDPLDGTREFVEGRLENVQCLVGVAVDGRAVAGAVGLPFGGEAGASVVVYGLSARASRRPVRDPWPRERVPCGRLSRPATRTTRRCVRRTPRPAVQLERTCWWAARAPKSSRSSTGSPTWPS